MKATVYRMLAHIHEYPGVRTFTVGWHAHHDECGWFEVLDEWHNAFWAADHHMRYDCGRHRQPSSGTYELRQAGRQNGKVSGYTWDSCPSAYEEDVHAGHIYKRWDEQKVWCPGPVVETGMFVDGVGDGNPRMPDGSPDMGALHGLKPGMPFEDEPHAVRAIEGGMRKYPTPVDIGFPLRGGSADRPRRVSPLVAATATWRAYYREVSGDGYAQGGSGDGGWVSGGSV